MDVRGHYSVTDAKGMATDNHNVRQKSVPARIRRVRRLLARVIEETRAMVARSNEDGEDACRCVNVEKPR